MSDPEYPESDPKYPEIDANRNTDQFFIEDGIAGERAYTAYVHSQQDLEDGDGGVLFSRRKENALEFDTRADAENYLNKIKAVFPDGWSRISASVVAV